MGLNPLVKSAINTCPVCGTKVIFKGMTKSAYPLEFYFRCDKCESFLVHSYWEGIIYFRPDTPWSFEAGMTAEKAYETARFCRAQRGCKYCPSASHNENRTHEQAQKCPYFTNE